MSNLKDKAIEYLKAQLSVLPTKEDKTPSLSWKPYQNQRMTEDEVEPLFNKTNVKGLAIICGAISGSLEVIDVDSKYDNTGTLWEELSALLQESLPNVYKELLIAKTKSGGYHLYYRSPSISGNLKLANRETTPEEREQTYQAEIAKGEEVETAKKRALNDKIRVLIETRGEGGYVIAPPSPGYTYIQGEPGNIPTITQEERDIILNISRSFNEVEEESKKIITTSPKEPISTSTGLTPFEDYNQRGNVIQFLEEKGWKITSQRGERINLLRPGQTDSKTSGNYHTGLKVLRVFSSSTEFNPEKGYSPSQVFSLLECNNDNKTTYKKLLNLGYGQPYEGETIKTATVKTDKIKVDLVNTINRESSVISNPGETLNIEGIETTVGSDIVITSPGPEAIEEVLKAIALLEETGKRIYIKEGDIEVREYRYQLHALFIKYGTLQEEKGELTDRDKDSLQDEVLLMALKLQPADKDKFLDIFLKEEEVKNLGISKESLEITIKRLTSTQEKEEQTQELNKLLSEAKALQDKGKISKALELLDNRVKDVKLKDKTTEFRKLLSPTSEEVILDQEQNSPPNLHTGYFFNKNTELVIPGGGLTIFAGPTNHGKTVLCINTALNILERYPDKKIVFLTLEERANTIIGYFLNTYMDMALNRGATTNRDVIKKYFAGDTTFLNKACIGEFNRKKEEFFSKYIHTGRLLVKYVDYYSEELLQAVRFINRELDDIGAIFIDYIQLLKMEGTNKARHMELKEICEDLKDVAVNTKLPIVLAGQFNRTVTNLVRLESTSIGEAGDIERSAHTIVGLWNMNKKPSIKEVTKEELKEIEERQRELNVGENNTGIYIELLKSRDYATGAYNILKYNPNTQKLYASNQSNTGDSDNDLFI